MNLFFIGGVNGVGKTSVIKRVADKSQKVLIIDGAKELMKKLGIENNYDKLRKIPDELINKSLIDLFISLSRKSDKRKALFAGHYIKILNGKISPSFGQWYKYCKALFFLNGDPKDIVRRISCDELNRKRINRSIFSTDQISFNERVSFIKKAQNISRDMAMITAKIFDKSFYVLENKEGFLGNTSDDLLEIINSY